MEIFLKFLVDNYLWILFITLILVFALIGYIVDSNEKKAPKLHFESNEDDFLDDSIVEEHSNESSEKVVEKSDITADKEEIKELQ